MVVNWELYTTSCPYMMYHVQEQVRNIYCTSWCHKKTNWFKHSYYSSSRNNVFLISPWRNHCLFKIKFRFHWSNVRQIFRKTCLINPIYLNLLGASIDDMMQVVSFLQWKNTWLFVIVWLHDSNLDFWTWTCLLIHPLFKKRIAASDIINPNIVKGSLDEKLPSYEVLKMLRE